MLKDAVSLAIQCMTEEALLHGIPLGGFPIDMVKCFNQLPRWLLKCILHRLKVPESVLTAWFSFLESNIRFALFHGDLGPLVISAAGVPAGDPLIAWSHR